MTTKTGHIREEKGLGRCLACGAGLEHTGRCEARLMKRWQRLHPSRAVEYWLDRERGCDFDTPRPDALW